MNAAIRSAVRQGLALEARMVGFRYGFDGIINADYMELAARSVGVSSTKVVLSWARLFGQVHD